MRASFLLAIACSIALIGPASAANFYRYAAPQIAAQPTVGGVVLSDGNIKYGAGFRADRTGLGTYIVRFDRGVFPTDCATMVVNPDTSGLKTFFAETHPRVSCPTAEPQFYVSLINAKTGVSEDAEFDFVAVGVEPR